MPELYALNNNGLLLCLGFWLAFLTNFLEANLEKKPPEIWLRVNNAILSAITSVALCDICIQNALFSVTSVPAYCALLGLMTDAHLWRGLGWNLIKRAAKKHNIDLPSSLKTEKNTKDESQNKDKHV